MKGYPPTHKNNCGFTPQLIKAYPPTHKISYEYNLTLNLYNYILTKSHFLISGFFNLYKIKPRYATIK